MIRPNSVLLARFLTFLLHQILRHLSSSEFRQDLQDYQDNFVFGSLRPFDPVDAVRNLELHFVKSLFRLNWQFFRPAAGLIINSPLLKAGRCRTLPFLHPDNPCLYLEPLSLSYRFSLDMP